MRTKEFDRAKPYVYLIKNKTTGLKYFGVRWVNTHKNRSPINDLGKEYFSSNPKLKKAFKKNPKNFEFKPIYTFDTKEEAIEYEIKFNKKIIKDKNWLNTSAFPQIIHTEQTKKKISKTKKGTPAWNKGIPTSMKVRKKMIDRHKGFTGRKHSKKNRKKMSEFHKGKIVSKETKKKLSESHKGQIAWNKGKTGIYSKATLKKISKASKGREPWHKGKTGVYGKEQLKKLAEKMKGNTYRRGSTHTKEARRKISLAHMGRIPWNKGKKKPK